MTDLSPNDLLLFARVADEGSFSAAAARLRLPKSTVSRRVAALETQLGERLLLRTTRKLTVTDFGQAVLEHAHHLVEDVEAAASLAQNRQIEPSGRLRVTMPNDLGNLMLAPFLADFVLRYPAISLEVDFTARIVDLVAENFDVAVRMGNLRDDASLAARKLATFITSLHASPAYLQRRGTPASPDDLAHHDVLHVMSRSGDPIPWTLHAGTRRWEGMPPGRASGNSPEVLMRMALHGVGIVFIHDHFAEPYVARGELVRVLPEWTMGPVDAWAVFPGRRLMPARTRVFIDGLAELFSGPECQAAEARAQKLLAAQRAGAAQRGAAGKHASSAKREAAAKNEATTKRGSAAQRGTAAPRQSRAPKGLPSGGISAQVTAKIGRPPRKA